MADLPDKLVATLDILGVGTWQQGFMHRRRNYSEEKAKVVAVV